MTDKQRIFCLTEASNYTDRYAYVSDLAISSIWGDSDDDDIPSDRLDAIGAIWDAANRSVKQIASDAGLSQRRLSERFCIPYRTVENWAAGSRTCPLYVRLMMQELLGFLR